MSGRRVAVLGAAGAIGSRFVERWALSGRASEVVAVVRRWSSAVGIARYPVEIRRADVDQGTEAIAASLEGVAAVVDLTYPKTGNPGERERAGRRMAESVVGACVQRGVRLLIHLGSVSSYGPLREPVHDEQAPEKPADGYGLAKKAATKAVLDATRNGGVRALVLEPTVVYGPRTGWSAGTLAALPRNQYVLPGAAQGTCPAVYVDDVCRAIEAALEAEDRALGRRYLVTGTDSLTWQGFLDAHAAIAGLKEPAWIGMPADELHRRREQQERQQRPVRRVVGLFKSDAQLRGAFLALPGLAQLRGAMRAATSDEQWGQIRNGLLSPSTEAVPQSQSSRGLLLPGPVQERLFSWQGSITGEAARSGLGFSACIGFDEGMRITASWARWAGLSGDSGGTS